jgi:hypothetical protein
MFHQAIRSFYFLGSVIFPIVVSAQSNAKPLREQLRSASQIQDPIVVQIPLTRGEVDLGVMNEIVPYSQYFARLENALRQQPIAVSVKFNASQQLEAEKKGLRIRGCMSSLTALRKK